MSNVSNLNSLSKQDKNLYKKYCKFLSKYEIDSKIKNSNPTHVTCGAPYKKYNIPDDKLDDFYEHYSNLCNTGRIVLHMVERPKEIGPFIIDLDYDIGVANRVYTENHIKNVIKITTTILRTYFQIKKSKSLQAFVFEKKKPSKRDKNDENGNAIYKDGFHIIYPNVSLTVINRYFVTYLLEKKIASKNILEGIDFTNDISKIIDKSVVNANGLTMIGSRKKELTAPNYVLTCVYDYENNLIENIDKSILTNVKLCSNRNHMDKIPLKTNKIEEYTSIVNKLVKEYNIRQDGQKNTKPIKNDEISDEELSDDDMTDEECDDESQFGVIKQYKSNKSNKSDKSKNNQSSEKKGAHKISPKRNDYEMAKELVKMLSKKRADDYNTWIKVGWLLFSVDERLKDEFHKFSKKCPSKYNHAYCEKIWHSARNPKEHRTFSIGTLHCWARHDNPEKYMELLRDDLIDLLEQAIDGHDTDVARIVYEFYKYEYKCVDLEKNVWYEYKNHRWNLVQKGYTLDLKISDEITFELMKLNNYYMNKYMILRQNNDGSHEKMMENLTKVNKLASKLKNVSTKNKIMSECTKLFYDSKFIEQLDSNRDLIGFNNGVYDLKDGYFRHGDPDDMLSFTTGCDYVPYDKDHEHVQQIKDLFRQIHRDKAQRKYIKTLLASYLDGHTKQQKFIFWTGTGCYQKNTKIKMFDGSSECVENIRVGDLIMGDDYTARQVFNLRRGFDKMYKVSGDNTSYVVNQDHPLVLQFYSDDNLEIVNKNNKFVLTWYQLDNNDIIKKYEKEFDFENEAYNYKNNVVKSIEYVENNLNICFKVKLYDTCKLKHKLFGIKNNNDTIYKYPITVEESGEDYYYGFEIDNNHLHLLEDGTVCHNSNGKSTIVDLFNKSIGDYAGVLPPTIITKKRESSAKANPEIAALHGKRFVVIQETEEGDKIYVGYMKEITGGDKIYARPLYGNPFYFNPQFKILLVCNTLPTDLPIHDEGTWRRLRSVKHSSEFVDLDENGLYKGKPLKEYQFPKDSSLIERFDAWIPMFMSYMLNVQYKKYRDNKYVIHEPAIVTEFTNLYRAKNDVFMAYFQEAYIITRDKSDMIEIDEVYTGFKSFYTNSHGQKPPTMLALKEYVEKSELFEMKGKFICGLKEIEDEDEDSDMD